MTARRWTYRLARFSVFVALAALFVAASRPAAADERPKLDTSVKLIPADAAFYSSMLRIGEQFQAIKHSNAWAKISEMPFVRSWMMMYQMQEQFPGSMPARLRATLNSPKNRDTVELLKQLVSDEVFVYGDPSFVGFVRLFQIVNSAQSFGSMKGQISAAREGGNPQQAQVGAVLSALAGNADLIRVPNVVVGFHVKNVKLAEEQLAKFGEIAMRQLDANEKTKGRLKKTKVGDHQCLVLTLDGAMVDWEVLADKLKEMETAEGDTQKIVDRLKESKLVIALGVRDNYLLLSIGSSLEGLEKLGKGELLIDRPELKPLAKFADKRLIGVGYASAALNQQAASQQQNVASLLKLLDQFLPQSGLNDEQKEQVRKDAEALARDIKSILPKPGAAMRVSFLVDHGVEGYQYSWGDHGDLEGSQPLGLLDHVGGSPLFGVVARQRVDVKHYELLVKWLKISYGYFQELGLPMLPDAEREKTQKFLTAAVPLAERLDKVTREMLFPALADGQFGFVFDADLKSEHFAESLPATEKPMPMIDPALVFGVSDAKLLAKALGQYREIANDLIGAAQQVEGSEIPHGLFIPKPTLSETPYGKVYTFPLPQEWGVDKQIVPNFGLSDKVAVVSITREHTERLLKSASPAIGGLLAKPDRPLAVAAWLHWAAMIDAVQPWVELAVDRLTANIENEDEKKSVADQVQTVLDVLKVLRSVTAKSYLEDGALVTHSFTEIRDLEKK